MLCIKALRKMVRTQYVPEEQHLYIVKALLFRIFSHNYS